MKLNDVKHNHSLTDLLKVLLFAIIMLLPFIDVFVRCGYVIYNKNAYQSYSGTNQNTETIVNISTINDFDYSKNYYLGNSALNTEPSTESSSAYMYFDSVNVINNNTSYTNETLSQFNRMYIYASTTIMYYNFFIGNTNYTLNSGQDFLLEVKIRSFNGDNAAITALNYDLTNSNILYYIEYFNDQQLDNVFEYSIKKLEESSLYNWTKNTAIYSGVSQMTTQLGITTNIIPIIVCYWFFITIIYIILDIVIRLFTVLTHLIGSKTST